MSAILRRIFKFVGRTGLFCSLNVSTSYWFAYNFMEAQLLEQRYTDTLNRYSSPGKKVITSYHGQMDQERISMLSYAAEHQLDNEGARRSAVKKIFNILIEMLQNILLHSASSEKNGNPFYMILAQNMDEYVLTTANIVRNDIAEKIKRSLEELKTMNEKQLKTHYMEVLGNDQFSIKGGAGLGLITIALKCQNHFTFEEVPIDGHVSFFTMSAYITDK